MNEKGQVDMRRRVVWTAAGTGGSYGLFVGLVGGVSLFWDELRGDLWFLPFVFAFVCALLGFFLHRPLVARQLERQIAASNDRMNSPAYRTKLAAMGFLKTTVK